MLPLLNIRSWHRRCSSLAHEPSVDGEEGRGVLTEFDIAISSVPPAQGVGGFGFGADGSSTFENLGSDLASSGDRLATQVGWIRQGAGPLFDEIELSVFAHHVDVTDDMDQKTQQFAAQTQTPLDSVVHSPHVLIGPTSAIVEMLLDRREKNGISYIIFDAADLDAIEPVVSHLAGQ